MVMGNWQGLIPRQAVSSSIGMGLQGRKMGKSLRHCQRKAVRVVGERNSGKWGEFVRNWYEIHTNFVGICTKCTVAEL